MSALRWAAAGLVLAACAPSAAAIAQTGAKTSADAPERAADQLDKIVCKRFTETGSLVKGYRTCKTKREWERERENMRAPRTASGSCASGAGQVC